jgi:hypothetical protein
MDHMWLFAQPLLYYFVLERYFKSSLRSMIESGRLRIIVSFLFGIFQAFYALWIIDKYTVD